MPRESTFHCLCWELDAGPEEVELLLAQLRRDHRGVVIQAFGAGRAPNAGAVAMIAAQTLAATKSAVTLVERPELDLLLRLAGTRQIGEAFRLVGYKSGGKRVFVVAASEGGSVALGRLAKSLSADQRFAEVGKQELGNDDLDSVEVAALLAARL